MNIRHKILMGFVVAGIVYIVYQNNKKTKESSITRVDAETQTYETYSIIEETPSQINLVEYEVEDTTSETEVPTTAVIVSEIENLNLEDKTENETVNNFEDMTMSELREIGKMYNVKGLYKLKKVELIQMLQNNT
jgi:hypothetical protein